ncbi:MAG: hypothetical protein ACI94Y_003697, partial [Maribacter sp.]
CSFVLVFLWKKEPKTTRPYAVLNATTILKILNKIKTRFNSISLS